VRIAIGQINPVVGDIGYNIGLMLENIQQAKKEQADMIVFPELAVIGYPPRDLLLREDICRRVMQALNEKILPASQGIGILLGAFLRETAGNRLYNSALLYNGGSIIGRQDKTLLPEYDVFDEKRYFTGAVRRSPMKLKGCSLGVTICEDIWNDKDFWGICRYDADPIKELAAQGIDMIINVAASPYHYGKRRLRADMLVAAAKKYGKPVFFVNQVGGNDELIFDGSSMLIDGEGRIVWQGKAFEEDFVVLDLPQRSLNDFQVREDIQCIHDALVLGTRDYIQKTGFSKAVLGLSGGIDSAVSAAIAVAALGNKNVLGVTMPSRYSSAGSISDSLLLAENLGIEIREISIEEMFGTYLKQLNPDGLVFQDVPEENLQARIRGNILMFISNREGHMLLSTGNKSEMAVGYSTLYGDMSGGLCVLGDVPKTTVYELAGFINRRKEVIPKAILTKAPSAELRPHQTDQDSLPPYPVLDAVLKAYIEDNLSIEEMVSLGFDHDLVEDITAKVDRAEYKRRQAPLVLRVTGKAFGPGRRYPIAWHRDE